MRTPNVIGSVRFDLEQQRLQESRQHRRSDEPTRHSEHDHPRPLCQGDF